MTAIPENPAERPAGMARYRRRRRIRAAVGTGVALAVLAAVAVAGRGFGGTDPQRPAASNLPPATAKISRATLVQTERVSGTLGYGAATPLNARTAAAHTITWLPPIGSIVEPGQPVYKVDDRPVVLLTGSIPLYRVLIDGVTGADVKEFERSDTRVSRSTPSTPRRPSRSGRRSSASRRPARWTSTRLSSPRASCG